MAEQSAERFARIADFYGTLIRKYGHDTRALDYARAESQQTRFRVMAEVMPLSNLSLLDVGCGFADFAGFLQSRFSGLKYTGIDLCPDMVSVGKRNHPDLDLRVANIAGVTLDRTFDVVTANGIFYLLGEQPLPIMQQIIERMFSLAKRAVAFSSLSAWAQDRVPGEFHADPLQTIEFCRSLSPWVVLRHDYHPGDFTVYLYKAARI